MALHNSIKKFVIVTCKSRMFLSVGHYFMVRFKVFNTVKDYIADVIRFKWRKNMTQGLCKYEASVLKLFDSKTYQQWKRLIHRKIEMFVCKIPRCNCVLKFRISQPNICISTFSNWQSKLQPTWLLPWSLLENLTRVCSTLTSRKWFGQSDCSNRVN